MFISQITIQDVTKLPTKSVFLSQQWLSIVNDGRFVINGIFNKNKELIGCFYYTKFSRGKILIQISASPFTPHCGLYVEDKTQNPSQKNTFEKKVMQLISDYFDEQKFDILELPFPFNFCDFQPFIWEKYGVKPRYTYQLDLSLSEEKLLAGMSSERRKNISKAKKDEIKCVKVTNFFQTKTLIESTYSRQKVKVEKQVFDSIFTQFSSDDNTICIVSQNAKGEALACVYCIYDEERCYYIMGGYDSELKHHGAGANAMWQAIKIAKEKGIKVFDFEGSMLPAVEKYFRGFGGEIKPFYSIKKERFAGSLYTKIKNKS